MRPIVIVRRRSINTKRRKRRKKGVEVGVEVGVGADAKPEGQVAKGEVILKGKRRKRGNQNRKRNKKMKPPQPRKAALIQPASLSVGAVN